MTIYQLDGHRFESRTVLDESDPEFIVAAGLAASCTCGWVGGDALPGMDGKGGYRGGDSHPITDDESEAERAAEKEWLEEHVAVIADITVPAALADQIRSVGEQLDALIQADRPMAALAAIRLSGGYFTRQARDAALRASFLDHSWSQIGEALGITKQSAWERYGKSRPENGTG
ncbi:hypothetical protein JHN59_40240 [Streptomyces sp. MBT49]|uniref:hypothetical protein n=1 Tax=unclassified Streptomyces TaxID=2593676 RepID=UPI00190DA1DA|nr:MULTISPECIES: hypothetical protein [unclassified Streptomyces]MBK3630915.1 hypothetical protein [Streptomyces sp. MBT49]MBK3637185.1 hypothetical protein [Streptomyces sp. MBT97]